MGWFQKLHEFLDHEVFEALEGLLGEFVVRAEAFPGGPAREVKLPGT
jgi:hypothetical protein